MPEFEIVNVVGWMSYRQEFDLTALEETFDTRSEITNVTYEPTKNHWVQTNFEPDETYVAFYRSGKCSITGAESIKHFEDVVERVNSVMQELLEIEYIPESEVSNVVVTTALEKDVRLEALALQLGLENVEYEPEQFPALIYRESDGVLIVFSSGKLLCTGLSDVDVISETIDSFIERINVET